jgi:hypothetical protein
VTVTPSAVGTLVRIDGVGDTGYFPSLALEPVSSDLVVTYQDLASKKLKFIRSAGFKTGVTPEVIDDGVATGNGAENAWVGADSAIAFGPGGKLFVAYQDATRGDLKLAVRGTGWEKLPPLRTEGAVGFYADAVFLGDDLFVSHAQIHTRSVAGEAKLDNRLRLEKLQAP